MKNFAKVFQSWRGLFVISTVALIGIAALSLTGCRATKPLQEKEYITKTDSVVIQSVLRDTTVRIEKDSASIRALLECDSLGRVRIREILSLKSGLRVRAPSLKLEGNTLISQAVVDSMSIYLTLKDRYHTRIRSDTSRSEKEVPVYVQRPWQKFLCWSGALCWLLLLGWIGYRAYNRFNPYLKSIKP